MTSSFTATDSLCINAIRSLALDAIDKAQSGHPGLPLGAAPVAYVLWTRHLKHLGTAPDWPDRDRFVLSAGHGSMLLYCLLHLDGYGVSTKDLQSFRQLGSKTPGHPEAFLTPGVEATTGPLGQGVANAVGMAIAERMLAAQLNTPDHTVVDHRTFALVSDGDLMEGISYEATALAGHLRLNKLTILYDDNGISLDGPTSLAWSENVATRFAAAGWHTHHVEQGDTDLEAIDQAITAATQSEDAPSIILVHTTLGFGSPHKQGTAAAHGSPLGPEETRLTKEALGWPETEPFAVPAEVTTHFQNMRTRGERALRAWQEVYAEWALKNPALEVQWEQARNHELPGGWDASLPTFEEDAPTATRQASGLVLNALADKIPWLVGGDADISSSTKTRIKSSVDFGPETPAGRNIRFGVREHAMGAIANGIAYHGGLRPFTGTFFQFSDYMRPAIRLAAMNRLPVVFVFTHDSLALGEDGPTHQPVEHLMSLRMIPDLVVIRPADARETREAWRAALLRRDGPTVLVLSRQKLPAVTASVEQAQKLASGGYVLRTTEGAPDLHLMATGSEVHLAVKAATELQSHHGIKARVISLPSWELFDAQPREAQEEVLSPAQAPRLAIEAGRTLGWQRWVGVSGDILGVDAFGKSGPAGEVLAEFGLSVGSVVERAVAVVERARAGSSTADR